MSLKKQEMPVQDPEKRIHNFEEVALGYSVEDAVTEANRCIQCKHRPCVLGCPVHVQIPEFIKKIQEKQFLEAYEVIKQTNSLPAVCGRVCPQETQCEARCVRGIKGESVAIGRLERFAADYYMAHGSEKEIVRTPTGKKVAVIGAGPAGLSCASDLGMAGHDVTIFEAFHEAGGVLVYGIPEFRLPKEIVKKEVASLKERGVTIQLNMVIGRIYSIDELLGEEGFDAIFIASGAGLPTFMGIEGETLLGVYSANEYLTRTNLMKAYKEEYDTPIQKSQTVAVVGGGNVAMDAARCAKRLGAKEVKIIYRRSEEELPARLEEIHHAKEEGIEFCLLTNPVRIIGDASGHVTAIECLQMELGHPDESGRKRPIAIENSNFTIDVDTVIMSIGTSPNPLIASTTHGLTTNRWGCIEANEKMETSRLGVFAGGDIVSGAATVINAMGAGKIAAATIHDYLASL